MRSILFILLFFAVTSTFVSCDRQKENRNVFLAQLGSDLQKAQVIIDRQTVRFYEELNEKVHDPAESERANIWNDKALQVKSLSGEWRSYLKKSFDGGQPDWAIIRSEFFKLIQSLKAIDPGIERQLTTETGLWSSPSGSIQKPKDFFEKEPASSLTAMSAQLSYGISALENQLVLYCKNNIGHTDGAGMFEKFSVLVGQSTTHLRKGETLIVTAGVGEFSNAAMPKFNIFGSSVQAINGYAEYKAKITDSPGRYSKAVTVDYINQNGERLSKRFDVGYTVDKD